MLPISLLDQSVIQTLSCRFLFTSSRGMSTLQPGGEIVDILELALTELDPS